nr:nucleoside hydrolase [Saccharopolyspora sp. HNM0983]
MDVDTGTDDAVAIMFAALHPEIDLLGVTTVRGNVDLAHTTDNTLRVLDHIDRGDIPVFPGLAGPIARDDLPGERNFGTDTADDPHGTTLPLPPASTAPQDTGAVEFLVESLRATTEPITLVPVGPLSNIATALNVNPALVDAVDEIVIMGGGDAVCNVTAAAEFNMWADPEAAQVALGAGFAHRTLVPLDATHRALVTRQTCTDLRALQTPAGTAAADVVERRIDAYRAVITGSDAAPVHDVVCTAHLVAPDLLTTRPRYVAVETTGTRTTGRTVVDNRPNSTRPANAHMAVDADANRLTDLLHRTFTRS